MKNRISLSRKISLFFLWRKTLKEKREEIFEKFNSRIDDAFRIYTVLNIPPQIVEEPYNLRKADIDALAQNYIKEYGSKISTYLNDYNLLELYDYYEVKKVDKLSYLVVIGYSLFKSHIFLRNLYISFFSIFLVLIVSLLIIIF
jgi:hypothetical protein